MNLGEGLLTGLKSHRMVAPGAGLLSGGRSQDGPRLFATFLTLLTGRPWWLSSKEPTCQSRIDPWVDPWVGKIPLEKKMARVFQYSYLGNPMGRGAWWATVHGVAKSRTGFINSTTLLILLTKKGQISRSMPPAGNQVYLELDIFVYIVFISMFNLLFLASGTWFFIYRNDTQQIPCKINLLSKQ